jgi:phage major head subunit gpT-like protein
MILNGNTLQGLNLGVSTIFNGALAEAAARYNTYQRLSTVIESNSAIQTYAWLGEIGAMREWIGPRQASALAAYDYAIKNRKFERTLAVKREEVEDDQLGLINPRVRTLTDAAMRTRDILFFEAFNNSFGAKGECYDGQPLISASHPGAKKGQTFSNRLSGNPVLSGAAIDAAELLASGWTDDAGNPLDVRFDTLVIPMALWPTARATFLVPTLGDSAAANPYYQRFTAEQIIVSPRIKDGRWWQVLDTSRPVRPYVFQNRTEVELASRVKPEDPNVFDSDEYQWGIRWRGAVGYGLWQTVVGSTGGGPTS